MFLDKANNAARRSRLDISSWLVGVGSNGSDRRGSGAKALPSLSLCPRVSLISSSSSWEVSHWLLAWVAIRGLSTSVVVLSWRVSGRVPSCQTCRSKEELDVGFLDILIVYKGS